MVVETTVAFAGVGVEAMALAAVGVMRAAAAVVDVLVVLAIVVLAVVGLATMALAVVVGLDVVGTAATTGADGALAAKGARVSDKDGPAPTASVGNDVGDEATTAAAAPAVWEDQSNDLSSIAIVIERFYEQN